MRDPNFMHCVIASAPRVFEISLFEEPRARASLVHLIYILDQITYPHKTIKFVCC